MSAQDQQNDELFQEQKGVEHSYKKSLIAFRSRENEYENLCALLSKFSANIDEELGLQSTRDCVSIGSGIGTYDLAFVNRCLLGLKSFVAVERDESNIDELRRNLKGGLPSDVICDVIHESVQNWKSSSKPVDVVLMLHILYYFTPAERATLYRRCFEQWLKPDGVAVILMIWKKGEQEIPIKEVFCNLFPDYWLPEAGEISEELSAQGYQIVRSYDFPCQLDFSEPDDHLRMFFNYVAGDSADLTCLRQCGSGWKVRSRLQGDVRQELVRNIPA